MKFNANGWSCTFSISKHPTKPAITKLGVKYAEYKYWDFLDLLNLRESRVRLELRQDGSDESKVHNPALKQNLSNNTKTS